MRWIPLEGVGSHETEQRVSPGALPASKGESIVPAPFSPDGGSAPDRTVWATLSVASASEDLRSAMVEWGQQFR